MKLFCQKPGHAFRTARQVAEALERELASLAAQERTHHNKPSASGEMAAHSSGVIACFLISLAVVFLWRRASSRKCSIRALRLPVHASDSGPALQQMASDRVFVQERSARGSSIISCNRPRPRGESGDRQGTGRQPFVPLRTPAADTSQIHCIFRDVPAARRHFSLTRICLTRTEIGAFILRHHEAGMNRCAAFNAVLIVGLGLSDHCRTGWRISSVVPDAADPAPPELRLPILVRRSRPALRDPPTTNSAVFAAFNKMARRPAHRQTR